MNQQRRLPVLPTLTGLATATCLVLLAPLSALAVGGSAPTLAATSCSSTRSGPDLNGDGYDDAVVGDPYATVDGQREAGAIVVLYGNSDCRIGEGARRLISQSTAGVPGTSEAGDHFGWSVAVGDLTDDGRTDIMVGSPGEDVGTRADAGKVHVLSLAAGSTASTISAVSLTQGNLRGVAEAGDQFGYTVAAAPSLGDEAGTLAAAGAPGEDVAGMVDAGEVDAFGFDGKWNLTAQFQQGRSNSSPFAAPVPGVPEAGDRFGASLLIAQLNSPYTGDVHAGPEWTFVMGAPGDVVSGRDSAGSVTLSYTQTGALEQVTQDTADVPDVAESGDAFGSSLAVHETQSWRNAETRTLRRNLAVGAPGEDVGTVTDAGSVTLFRSTDTGLQARDVFTQNNAGFGGHAEAGDRFGSSVAMRPELDSSDAVLVIGAPYEDVGKVVDAGLAQTVTVTATGTNPLRTYTEASENTPGTVATGNRFGLTVTATKGRAESLWAISSPYQGAGSVFLSNQSGQERSWTPGQGGVPMPAGAGRFGWAVSGLQSGH